MSSQLDKQVYLLCSLKIATFMPFQFDLDEN